MAKHKIGTFYASLLVAGNMMGSGVAMLPASLAELGSITIFSWILSSLGGLALAYVFARLAQQNPQEGGPVAYAGEVAPILGHQTGVLYFNANWIGNLAIAITSVTYLSYFFPILKSPMNSGIATISIIWIFTFVNLLGSHWIAKLVSIGVLLLLIPILLTGTYGWFFFKHHTFIHNWNATKASDIHTVFSGVLLCIWSFIGVETASVEAGLVKDPAKTVPRATLIGVFLAILVYTLSCTAISGMFANKDIIKSGAPFSLVARYMFGGGGAFAETVVSVIVAFACMVSLSSWMMLVAESGARAAQDGTLPKIFAEKNSNGTPIKGMLITSTGMSLLLIPFMFNSGSSTSLFSDIATIAVLMTILPYFYSTLNLIDVMHVYSAKDLAPVRKFFVLCFAVFAMVFCASAYIGAKDYELLSVTIIALFCMVFYVQKNREPFEKSIYKRVRSWKIED